MTPIVYFNGTLMDKDQVRISPDDRGFLFADGVYEVVRSYAGRFFELDPHFRRLEEGLFALRIEGADIAALRGALPQLLERNGLGQADAAVYLQITRGAAPRIHSFPDPTPAPTVYAEAKAFHPKGDPVRGAAVVTVPDVRWARCDIKSVALLPNCLANQRAREAGALEAVFVRDGVALEASASSFFAVIGGEVRTAPKSNYILPSISRAVVLDLCARHGIPARETPVFLDQLPDADELFLAGTTLEVMPVVSVDGRPVADGKPGPVSRRLHDLFRTRATGADD
jgi:D-alanine transaminase